MTPSRNRLLFPRRVRVYEPNEVTRTADDEASEASVGLPRGTKEAIWRSVVNFYKMGLQPSIALCIRYKGLVLMDRALGHIRGNAPGASRDTPKIQATPDSLYNLFSASKVITAVLLLQAVERGEVALHDPVSKWIPEFARHGKAGVTLEHVLAHRAGIPWIPGDRIDLDILADPDEMIRRICDLTPISNPGQEAAYHALSGGFVLGEVLHRATGMPIQTLLLERIRKPLGLRHMGYGVPRPYLNQVAEEAFTGPAPPRPFRRLLKRALGMEMHQIVDVANDPRFLLGVVPAGNVVGTAREASRFMEVLRCGGTEQGVQLLHADTVAMATARQRQGHEIDRIIKLPVRYGLGFMLGSDHLSLYGQATRHAFGHLGFTNVVVWADPQREMSVALLNNGKPFVTPELLLWLNVMRTISSRIPPTS